MHSKVAQTGCRSLLKHASIGTTIFIAGVYGTGKSTICAKVADRLQLPAFSAGDLISQLNGEQYGRNKTVADRESNQLLLERRVRELHQKNKRIILAGHFCIFDAKNDVQLLPESVYDALAISRIILLEADSLMIARHLKIRDNKDYPPATIAKLAEMEQMQSRKISLHLRCPLAIYTMTFSEKDTEEIVTIISGD